MPGPRVPPALIFPSLDHNLITNCTSIVWYTTVFLEILQGPLLCSRIIQPSQLGQIRLNTMIRGVDLQTFPKRQWWDTLSYSP